MSDILEKRRDAALTAAFLAALLLFAGCRDFFHPEGPTKGAEITEIAVPASTLQAALDWLDSNAKDGGAYIITLRDNESLWQETLFYSGKKVSITLKGDATERTVSNSDEHLFTVESGVTLTLDDNVTLQRSGYANTSLVSVNSGGALVMKTGSKITGGYGGGVSVSGGTFTMSGGKISGNFASDSFSGYGSGVYVNSGTFTMSGGEISGNTANYGGGVYVESGTFAKQSGGTIYGSDADSTLKNTAIGGKAYGHAVYVYSGSKKRNSTAGEGVTLNSSASGAEGGWEYTVTFNLDGGAINGSSAARAADSCGSVGSANMPVEPTKSGCTFGGWWTLQNGGGAQFTATTTVNADITVYAKWTVNTAVQYTVTFDLAGGDIDGNSSAIGVFVDSGGSTGGAMPSSPTKSGCTFGGWWTLQNGGGTEFTATTTVTADITVYAKWTADAVVQHTVTFDADGGSPATQARTVDSGGSVGVSNMPTEPTKSGCNFGGWWSEKDGGGTEFIATTTVTSDITVYAKWVEEMAVPASTLQAALDWLDSNAKEGGAYTITLSADESIGPGALSYSGKNVGITLKGDTTERTVSLSSTGSLFTVGSGVTLTLDSNITLQGRSDNTAGLVYVNSGGTLKMNSGSKISGNTSTFTSTSSTYSYDYDSGGGGVYISGGTFTMSGGEISGNTATSTFSTYSYYSGGGGVYMSGGTFTMSGGEISGNTADSSSSSSNYSGGGGMYMSGGTFTMNGGEISGNTADSSSSSSNYSGGGGVYMSGGTFTMNGGEISGNTADSSSSYYSGGGGVYVSGSSGEFTMSGGEISGNTASSSSGYGGGVYVDSGGVYVDSSGTFTKQSGGTIYGADADSALKNTAAGGNAYGHAVYVSSGGKIRNSTAGEGVTLDSETSGVAGGWQPNIFQISLQPASDDPPLSNASLFVNESAQFSIYNSAQYYYNHIWYWDGEVISGASYSTYTLSANSKTPGIYELSVVVATDTGEKLSARCRVVIKAN